jgi:hypothetical protein
MRSIDPLYRFSARGDITPSSGVGYHADHDKRLEAAGPKA